MQIIPVTFRRFIKTYNDLIIILSEHGASLQNTIIDIYFKKNNGKYESKRLNNLEENYEFPWYCIITDIDDNKIKYEFDYSLLNNKII